MQASESQQAAPMILFFFAVALVFVGNAFLLHGSSMMSSLSSSTSAAVTTTPTDNEKNDSNIRTVSSSASENIMTQSTATAAAATTVGAAQQASNNSTCKKSLSKYRALLWPGRRSISMSPSCTFSKRLRSRSGSFSGNTQVIGPMPSLQPPSASSCPEMAAWRVACKQWLFWDPNPHTREVVTGWLKTGDEQTATKLLLGKRLAFGTSGLRGKMGAGYGRMNDLVVIQTTQGLCRYLEKEGGEEFKKRGVLIGHDHRAQVGVSSEGFARLAAAVFASRGFKVYFLSGTMATPIVAFGVSHLNACAGLMVTASHNPKLDNGYKVYWGNGSQIIPPHDTGIASSIRQNLEPWQTYNVASAISGPNCSDTVETLAKAYFQGIGDKLCRRPKANACSDLEVVYSAMHGVGDAWAKRAFAAFSLPPLISVDCQRLPDPDFPTLQYPNPEEQGALKEAIRLAEDRGVSLVLANDPDADRLAAAERQPSGEWHVFSGNEIGVLLGVWQWEEWRRTHPSEDPSKAVMIASTVSSKMLSAVANKEGFRFEETLPGFKWMGHRAQELKAQGYTVLFAFEEAIGFGPGDVVFEKDGLSSAALFCEMVVALREQDAAAATTQQQQQQQQQQQPQQQSELAALTNAGLSLLRRRLQALHQCYGEFAEDNGYVRCEDTEVVSAIFRRLRGEGKYRSYIGDYRVTAVRDLAAGHGYDSEMPGGMPSLPLGGGGTHFLTFKLGDEGVVATLRTSGTEPKIKYYLEMQGQPGIPLKEVSERLSEVASVFIEECLQPKRWGLQRFSWA